MAEYHAILSPSSADRWMTCPGSVVLSEGITDEGSEYAAEGTAAHEIAANALVAGLDAIDFVGETIKVGRFDILFTQEMADDTQVYIDLVRQRVTDYELAGAHVTLEVEQRVPIGHLTLEEDAEGTSDAVLIVEYPDERVLVEVIDLKFGRGVEVQAQDNKQLRVYALGAVRKFELDGKVSDVKVTISQPRISKTPSEWELPYADLVKFGESVKAAAHGVRAARICSENNTGDFEAKYLQPSEKACKFCKAKARLVDGQVVLCPAQAKAAAQVVNLDGFEDLTAEAVVEAQAKLSTTGDEALAKVLAVADLLQDFFKAAMTVAYQRLEASANDPKVIEALGFKIVDGKPGNRAWKDEEEAEKVLKSMRLKHEEMYQYKLISPTAAEDLAPKYDSKGKLKPDQGETRIGHRQWLKLQGLITRADPKPTLARASDKKPAKVLKTVAEEFENLDEAGPFYWEHPESGSFGQVDTREELDAVLAGDPCAQQISAEKFAELEMEAMV